MSQVFGIKPHDMRHMKLWQVDAMVLALEEMQRRDGS